MKRVHLMLVFLLLTVLVGQAIAQNEEEEQRDILEISIDGGLSIPTGDLSNCKDTLGAKVGFSLGLEAGYFVTPNFVAGLNFIYGQYTIDTNSPAKSLHHRLYDPSLYLTYYFFGQSSFVPYLKAQFGLDNPKFATVVTDTNGVQPTVFRELSYDPALSLSGSIGMLVYTSDFSGLFLEASYHHAFSDNITGSFQGTDYSFGVNNNLIEIRFGVRAFFGKY